MLNRNERVYVSPGFKVFVNVQVFTAGVVLRDTSVHDIVLDLQFFAPKETLLQV